MIIKRPSIFIYHNYADKDILKEICAGIEEEGVSFEIFTREETDLDTLAHEAADDSMMGSGIGIKFVDVAMQMKGLPKGRNVEQYHLPSLEQCRKIGANSARAIKKMAFK